MCFKSVPDFISAVLSNYRLECSGEYSQNMQTQSRSASLEWESEKSTSVILVCGSDNQPTGLVSRSVSFALYNTLFILI